MAASHVTGEPVPQNPPGGAGPSPPSGSSHAFVAHAPEGRHAAISAALSAPMSCLLPKPRCECEKTRALRRPRRPGSATATEPAPALFSRAARGSGVVIWVEAPPRSSAPTVPISAGVI